MLNVEKKKIYYLPGISRVLKWFGICNIRTNLHFCAFEISSSWMFNPRLPKVFSVTHLPKGGAPPHELEIDMPKVWMWYHSIGKGLPFPLIPKFWKSANVWRHNDVFNHGRPEKADFQGNIGQNWIFAKKVPNIKISPGFLLSKEENCVSNMFCKFQDNTMKIFLKMAT